MNRILIDSTNIASAGYDELNGTMELEFLSGEIYQYLDVPPYMYEGLLNALSKSIFFDEYIKDAYRFVRILQGVMY